MTFKEIQEKLKKCELALTSIKDGSYSSTKYKSKEEAIERFTTLKESLEKKLNLLKEQEETMFISTKGGDTKAVSMNKKAAMDLKSNPNITKITTAKGQDLKEDDLTDEEQEEVTTQTSHTEVVAKEVHKALIDALQDTGHEVSEDSLSSLNPETFTINVRFKDNTQSDYSFEFKFNEVKLEGEIIVTTNKKGVTPVLNRTIAKDNLIKYFKNLSEELDPVGEEDDDINNDGKVDDTDKYLKKRRDAISKNIKEEDTEFEVDAKGKPTGNLRLKLSDKDKETLKKIEDLLAKEKSLKEVNYNAYTKPKHFDICPGAEALRKELLDGGKTPKELGEWTYIHDELFKLEKDVLKSKKATDSDVKKAEQYASNLINISRDLGIDAGKVNYLKGHVNKIKDVADKKEVKETKGAPKGHYFTKSGNLVKGRLTKDARERGARLSDPLDKQRSKVPPVTQYNEGEGDDHHYIKVPRREFKKAEAIIAQNIDGNHVKMDYVDNDGAGNVIFYFMFKSDDIISGEADSFMFDAVEDLKAHDINVADHSADYFDKLARKALEDEMDEALDHNDPVLMRARVAKMRADDMKKLDALKKTNVGFNTGPSRKEKKARALVQKLKAKRAEIEREMENDPGIEPEGGPVADMYGDQLNKIDNAIEKAASVYNKPMDYDTAVGKVSEDMDVGHVDDEPGMLKQDAYEIAQYSIQLFKLLKHYESLDVEVDFPNWWQRKVMLARDYISKATHYLDFKTNEPEIDSQAAALEEGRSANVIKKDFDELVDKMRKLAKHYKTADGVAKQRIVTALKQHTDKKKALEKELDQAIQKTGAGQELDTSINELSGDQRDALIELQNILDDAANLGEQARDIIRQSFPNMLSKADAYGAFDLGSSSNRYDTTLASIIEEIEEYYDEEEDVEEGKYKSDAQRKAIYATKAEKGELKEEIDGGRLFDYFKSKGYDITERRPDGYPPKEGVEGYLVSRGSDRYPQSVVFQYNKDTDEFTISRMSGYRIDQDEAVKAGMREKGRSGAVGMDSYMTDGNYTPVSISAEGLKDIVDHVMTGLDRESEAQRDFYKDRKGSSGTIDENQEAIKFAQFVHAHKLKDGQIKDDEYLKDIYDNFKQNYEDDNPDNFFMDIDEKAPGYKHDCAAKVVHEVHGEGICIPEKHTLIKEGNKYVVTHYDVLFKEGKKVVEDIPVKELKIITQKEHWHKGYKKKKK